MQLNRIKYLLVSLCFIFLSTSCVTQSLRSKIIYFQKEYSHAELIEAMDGPDKDIREYVLYALSNEANRLKRENKVEEIQIIAKDSCNSQL